MSESLRDFHLFVAVYEERSFTAAAAREHATQSGVSQHVRKLEDSLGVRLFSRDKGQVVPTPAGGSLYQSCIEMLRLHEQAKRAVQDCAWRRRTTGGRPDADHDALALAPVLASFMQQPERASRSSRATAPLTQQIRAAN